MQTKYLSAAETAKLVRAALKRNFPGVKFGVRSSTYSMGASIDVSWTDGPASKMVDAVVGCFAGSNFDASIDMKTGHSSWLMPDGSTCVASASGTVGSMGYIEAERNWMPSPDAVLVSFGADYVHTQRRISLALLERVRARLDAKGYPVEAVELRTTAHGDAYVHQLSPTPIGFDMYREMMNAAHRTHCT